MPLLPFSNAPGSGGGSGSPGGSSGQVQYNNSGSFGGLTVSGDGTLNTGTGALLVTKTNGAAFATSATTDTTNAANISSGTLPAARLPNPSATTLGGIESIAAISHKFVTSISTAGVPSLAQPATSDISGLGTSAVENLNTVIVDDGAGNLTIGATTVTNAMLAGSIAASKLVGTDIATVGTITSGTWHGTKVGLAYGGTNVDLTGTGGTSQVLKQTSSGGNITVAQLAASDLSNGTTGSGAVVLAGTPTLTTAVLGSSTATTQTPADNSTKVATTAYVDNAVLGQNFKEAVKYASTGPLPSIVYSSGAGTITGVALAAISLDSSSPAVNDRVLIKNQASSFQNGIYTVTTTGSGIAVFVLTRANDANQSGEFKTGDSVFITAGFTLSNTTWAYTGIDSPNFTSDAITYAQVAGQGSFTAGNGIAITGTSIAIDTSVTVDKTTAQTLTNKTLTAPAVNSPTGIVKGDVGLGNVDNTSDATKNAASVTLTNKTFGTFTVTDANNIVIGTSSGTQIGTGATQKIGFYGTTPVVQQTGNLITGLSNLGLVTSGSIAAADVTGLTSAWSTWSPTFGGFSSPPTATTKYYQIGKMVYAHLETAGSGTSNATTKTVTLPVAPKNSFSAIVMTVKDNGSIKTTPGSLFTTAASTTASVYVDTGQSTTWTASGSCFFTFDIVYEAN